MNIGFFVNGSNSTNHPCRHLTIVGYSPTAIVVYDRVREDLRKTRMPAAAAQQRLNGLSRTAQ
jgi:hypothetical protein